MSSAQWFVFDSLLLLFVDKPCFCPSVRRSGQLSGGRPSAEGHRKPLPCHHGETLDLNGVLSRSLVTSLSLCGQVDNGCLRKNEAEKVVQRLKNSSLNINLTVVAAADRFLDQLEGVVDPEQKRKTIGRIFIEIFQEEAKKIGHKVS